MLCQKLVIFTEEDSEKLSFVFLSYKHDDILYIQSI